MIDCVCVLNKKKSSLLANTVSVKNKHMLNRFRVKLEI